MIGNKKNHKYSTNSSVLPIPRTRQNLSKSIFEQKDSEIPYVKRRLLQNLLMCTDRPMHWNTPFKQLPCSTSYNFQCQNWNSIEKVLGKKLRKIFGRPSFFWNSIENFWEKKWGIFLGGHLFSEIQLKIFGKKIEENFWGCYLFLGRLVCAEG
jgi:hypothetical protein